MWRLIPAVSLNPDYHIDAPAGQDPRYRPENQLQYQQAAAPVYHQQGPPPGYQQGPPPGYQQGPPPGYGTASSAGTGPAVGVPVPP